jgi:hypothetical protein
MLSATGSGGGIQFVLVICSLESPQAKRQGKAWQGASFLGEHFFFYSLRLVTPPPGNYSVVILRLLHSSAPGYTYHRKLHESNCDLPTKLCDRSSIFPPPRSDTAAIRNNCSSGSASENMASQLLPLGQF